MGVWSYDFVDAQTHDGPQAPAHALIDEFTRSPPFGASANLTIPCHTGAAARTRVRPRPWRRIGRIALQARPRSADRTRSPAAISQKREFFKCPPETIGCLALRMPKIAAWRPVANS